MNKRFKSALFISLQFTLIALLLFTTSHWRFSFAGFFFIAASLLLVTWAVVTMLHSKLRISPIPADSAQLVISGPYRFIRHPMYASILLGGTGLLLIYFSWLRLMFGLMLLVVLLLKLTWEEKMLSEKFPAYEDYTRRSKRIVPYVF